MAWTLDREFPTDLWAEHGFPADFDVERAASAVLPVLDARFGASRDMRMVEQFCREYLAGGNIFIYGAGTHTRALLPALRRVPGLNILGIVDRLAAGVSDFEGVEVILPEQLRGKDYDYILLSHGQYETEMSERLAALGISGRKVVPIYTNDRFRQFSSAALVKQVEALGTRKFANVIINCTKDSIVADAELQSLLPPEETVKLFMGRLDAWQPDGLYESIDLHESLDALCAVLRVLKPRTVYVRSIIYKNFLSMVIKKRFPNIFIVHEVYDYAASWRDEDLISLFGMNAQTIFQTRMTELYSGNHLDALISKRGGIYWNCVSGRCAAPYELYFPMIAGNPAAAPSRSDEVTRLAYCGFLPAASFLAQFKNGYNFLDLMEALGRHGGFEIDLFNAVHFGAEQDCLFENYQTRFETGAVHYHRRLPFGELVSRMRDYDFGWLCELVDFFQPDRYFGIGNRWTSNIMAGLPTLIDDSWKFMGDLTVEYDAGIVVSDVTLDGILSSVERGRSKDFRSGVRRLHRHLKARNESALDRIAELSARHRRAWEQ